MSKVIIVGGGAAGMMASIKAAEGGHEVSLYEKNEKLGKKIYITGKGRCNVTNACDVEDLFKNMPSHSKFMYSGFYSFSNHDMMDYLESIGVRLKVERGDRVFPLSDHSSDIIIGLTKQMQKLGVHIHLNTPVDQVCVEDGHFSHICLKNEKIYGDAVIIATGGLSYPTTGSTGDGYAFAKALGHKVTKTTPSLVPMIARESLCKELQGLALKNVSVTYKSGGKSVYSDFGEMLFTHFGVTGPVVLSGSAYAIPYFQKNKELTMIIDLKPALTLEQLDLRLLRDFEENKNKQFRNAIGHLLPSKMLPVMIELSGIDPYKKVNTVTKEERLRFCENIKALTLHIDGFRGYNEAVITKGGVDLKDINPSTMASKKAEGIYFAGEVLDLDALTGGFNLQIAWSTGYLAGINAGNQDKI